MGINHHQHVPLRLQLEADRFYYFASIVKIDLHIMSYLNTVKHSLIDRTPPYLELMGPINLQYHENPWQVTDLDCNWKLTNMTT